MPSRRTSSTSRRTYALAARALANACLLLCLCLASLGLRGVARAENRVSLRGNYYREASTRILSPTLSADVDVPNERLTLGVDYLLDAITSASIAAGAQAVTGGDNAFTELRHEATGRIRSRLGRYTLGAAFRASTEPDYSGRWATARASVDLFDRAGTLSLTYSHGFDRIYRVTRVSGNREPWTSHGGTNLLASDYVAIGYTHALTPKLLGLLGIEGVHSRGPQDNPYRGAQILNGFPESHPWIRRRLALSGQLRYMIPHTRLVLEPNYRFYVDDWAIKAHAIDTRVHLRVRRYLLFRARYRFYTQSAAFFWRDDGVYEGGLGICAKGAERHCATADPKMDAWHSHTPGIQVAYEFDGLARHKGFGWLRGGVVEATYNHVFQTNRYGAARLGSLSLSLAF